MRALLGERNRETLVLYYKDCDLLLLDDGYGVDLTVRADGLCPGFWLFYRTHRCPYLG
ncbi:MAG TPA: hypothetical protein VIW47_15370 [Nitrospiraceae bacterium]